MNKAEIEEKIEKLEREKIGYLEVDDRAGVRRKDKQIAELQKQIELLELKEDLGLYKKFISKRGLKDEFQNFIYSKV